MLFIPFIVSHFIIIIVIILLFIPFTLFNIINISIFINISTVIIIDAQRLHITWTAYYELPLSLIRIWVVRFFPFSSLQGIHQYSLFFQWKPSLACSSCHTELFSPQLVLSFLHLSCNLFLTFLPPIFSPSPACVPITLPDLLPFQFDATLAPRLPFPAFPIR